MNGFQNGIDKNSLRATLEKYDQEREKRLRSDGVLQYIDICQSEKFKRFAEDPWYHQPGAGHDINTQLILKKRHRVLIVGAGYGGLLFAIRLIQSGVFTLDDIVLVDSAGGFGGTWYWNRYPGLMCDVESYIYMPLLEETGYMPSEKYAPGHELRQHAERIAKKWELEGRALFRTTINNLTWDDEAKQWNVQGVYRPDSQTETPVCLEADFVILASGLLNFPKLADIPGIEDYQGHAFHTSRWDYGYTGGSPKNPKLSNLADKKVGIIGTGATAIQAIPQLARWAKELIVFQRTPSSVDRRDNCYTDVGWWEREVLSRGAGWQRERMENFNAFGMNTSPLPKVNMVDDQWSRFPSYSILIGGPSAMEPGYLESMQAVDLERQERIHSRVDEVVANKSTADSLKPWYLGWCKRPCFHDDYLQAFNQTNVHLIDTQGKGIKRLTTRGALANDTEYDLDLIIFSTGFQLTVAGSPASRGSMSVTGRHGKCMDDKWSKKLSTLHGVVSRDFPNLFYPGPSQAAVCSNQVYVLDQLSTHVAYIVSEAAKRAGKDRKVAIEPTQSAEEDWAVEILKRAGAGAGVAACTPGYLNGEGTLSRLQNKEEMINLARLGTWREGVAGYIKIIEEWRAKGDMPGLDVQFSNVGHRNSFL